MNEEPKRKRSNQSWESWIDEVIREAQAQGQFDNLAGAGKPLRDRRNPYLPGEDQLAYDLIQDSGHTLAWIDDAKEIDRRITAVRQRLQQDYAWYQQAGQDATASTRLAIEATWERHRLTFIQEVADINRLIDTYNLKAPTGQLHKYRLIVAEEFARIGVDTDPDVHTGTH